MKRYAVLLICVLAVVGYALPAFWVQLKFLGVSRSYDFGVSTFFKKNNSFDRMNVRDSDISDILSENETVTEIGGRIVWTIVSYFSALILFFTAAAMCLFQKKHSASKIFLSTAALILHIVSSRILLTVPHLIIEELNRILTETLGFFAVILMNSTISRDIITINTGSGYWITLSAMVFLAIVNITWFFFFNEL